MRKLKLSELGRTSVEDFKSQEKMPLVLVLDNIRSRQNVGSIFRTSDAFAVEKIVACGICPIPPHRDIHKTALGATETVDWEYNPSVVEVLVQYKDLGYKLIGLEQTSESLLLDQAKDILSSKDRFVLVLGNEVNGISDECLPLLDHCIEIPQVGTKHSLNVSVATGIAVWWFFEQKNRF